MSHHPRVMSSYVRRISTIASISAALAVALGAFGAHGLRGRLSPALLATYHTGVEYHFYHSLGLFAVAFAASLVPSSTLIKLAGWFMVAGIILFSGSLYTLSLTGIRILGAVAPIGGTAFILAWVLLAIAFVKKPIE